MAFYDGIFRFFGLENWCATEQDNKVTTMADLLAKVGGNKASDDTVKGGNYEEIFPFPSLDALHKSCETIPRSRDLTAGIEDAFLAVREPLKMVLDPITQPLSWALDATLAGAELFPWWIMLPLLLLLVRWVSASLQITLLVGGSFIFLSFVDHYQAAMQTLSIIFVCTVICVLIGVPLGIAMSRNDRLQRAITPILDLLQTLPTFVYLIPLIFLFSVTESKLYGIAIILYAVVPLVRLTDLGIRLVDAGVIEAAESYGMTKKQKLFSVQIPLALPNIMAGINQTIMMALAMVVIASLVSAPGLGTLVLRGINRLELGVGILAGIAIVLLAIMLDRVTKNALLRIDRSSENSTQ